MFRIRGAGSGRLHPSKTLVACIFNRLGIRAARLEDVDIRDNKKASGPKNNYPPANPKLEQPYVGRPRRLKCVYAATNKPLADWILPLIVGLHLARGVFACVSVIDRLDAGSACISNKSAKSSGQLSISAYSTSVISTQACILGNEIENGMVGASRTPLVDPDDEIPNFQIIVLA
ncbi:predicted protein [Histoplasma capsulatum H143]|uniref:Uncharacterized protein n=1 Tax=Ajellomyces capsulatus (strain H143) TaxID=544712 RepID=C6H8M4_AJECH|nr:predicted protein [Histoplasma capsulatum H143]